MPASHGKERSNDNPASKKPQSDKGSYVTVYKKQADGSWKAASDIATNETPAIPPPPAKK